MNEAMNGIQSSKMFYEPFFYAVHWVSTSFTASVGYVFDWNTRFFKQEVTDKI